MVSVSGIFPAQTLEDDMSNGCIHCETTGKTYTVWLLTEGMSATINCESEERHHILSEVGPEFATHARKVPYLGLSPIPKDKQVPTVQMKIS